MAIKRVGYRMPSSMAGIMSPGRNGIGGYPITPKTVLIITLIFVLIVLVLNIFGG